MDGAGGPLVLRVGHACVLHPCSPISRSWVAFCFTVGDFLPGELVHVSPTFSTAWGTHRITETGGHLGSLLQV